MPRQIINATAVNWTGHGILILGPSGSGKSDLAIRLIDAGARLVADDVVALMREGDRLLMAFPVEGPPELKGRIEVRGLGIVPVPVEPMPISVDLAVFLTSSEKIQRLPEIRRESWLGQAVRAIELAPFEASAVAKLRLALRLGDGDIIPPQ